MVDAVHPLLVLDHFTVPRRLVVAQTTLGLDVNITVGVGHYVVGMQEIRAELLRVQLRLLVGLLRFLRVAVGRARSRLLLADLQHKHKAL